MLRNSMTAVLERDGIVGPTYVTEPYESAWAIEARWFLRTLQWPNGVDRVDVCAQISPDGLNWCDLPESSATIHDAGLATFTSNDFGGWLRLRASVIGDSTSVIPGLIYLALKG